MKAFDIDQETAKLWFEYDAEAGHLIWRANKSTDTNGIVAGFNRGGGTKSSLVRRFVKVNAKTYHYHRVIWILHHGKIPDGMFIDHIDGDNLNNRIENLRIVTCGENNKNKRKYKNNTSGHSGVSWYGPAQKWVVKMYINGKRRQLGSFTELGEAVKVRKQAELMQNYHKNHGRENLFA